MRRVVWILGMLVLAWAGAWASAHAGGEEVVVIYNAALPESRAVADHYVRKRAVPPQQVFGFKLSTGSDMSRAEYRDKLLRPLVVALTNSGLARFGWVALAGTNGTPLPSERRITTAQFRYAVLCYGVPWRIKPDPGLFEPEAGAAPPEPRRNEAAVDSELACLPFCERPYPLVGPLSNPFHTTTNAAGMHPTNGLLMVTRLDGPTPEIARGLVDKALEAERDGWWGRAYFDLRGSVAPELRQGEEWLGNAAQLCRQLGFETVVDTHPEVFSAGFPMSQIAFYAGWYRENVCGPFALPEVEFMPGAFAYHLHSFSAASLHSSTQQWVGPFLAKGVTITMGSVQEPYLGGTPDIGIFAARLIFQGMSFGEAAYAAQNALSWQTTVVGDPLYRPYGRRLQELHDDLRQRQSPLLAWSHLRLVNVNLANQSPVADMVDYIENIEPPSRDPILTEKLGDLYAAQGKPLSSADAYGRALRLARSRQQQVRLALGLADKLTALGRSKEAREILERFLADRADYPDKPAVYRRLVALANALNKPETAAQYSNELNRTFSAAPGAAPRK